MTSKLTGVVAKASDEIRLAANSNKAIQFTIGSNPLVVKSLALTKTVTQSKVAENVVAKPLDEVISGMFLMNPIIDRNTMQASTETNDVMNFWFDSLG